MNKLRSWPKATISMLVTLAVALVLPIAAKADAPGDRIAAECIKTGGNWVINTRTGVSECFCYDYWGTYHDGVSGNWEQYNPYQYFCFQGTVQQRDPYSKMYLGDEGRP